MGGVSQAGGSEYRDQVGAGLNPGGGQARRRIRRFDALAAIDAAGTCQIPASVLIRDDEPLPRLLACGSPGEVDGHPAASVAERVVLAESVLLPGLVNAHTHLDLTGLGPQGPGERGSFAAWVDGVRRHRPTDPAEIRQAVARGVALSLAGGTVAVGDIAGAVHGRASLVAAAALARAPLLGVSFIEFFGMGEVDRDVRGQLARLLDDERFAARAAGAIGVRFGLSPHAPYSVSRRLYGWVARQAHSRGIPLCTHLAESLEERQLVQTGEGPMRDLLVRLGRWDRAAARAVGRGCRPVAYLRHVLERARVLVVHANDVDDDDMEVLARTRTPVVYCPRSADWFDARRHLGPHRYREMLSAGISVALGTDSLLNLPAESADPARGGMSVLAEMRWLYNRDGTAAEQLLAMATVHGAEALGLDGAWFRFSRRGGPMAGLVAVEVGHADGPMRPMERVLAGTARPVLLAGPRVDGAG